VHAGQLYVLNAGKSISPGSIKFACLVALIPVTKQQVEKNIYFIPNPLDKRRFAYA